MTPEDEFLSKPIKLRNDLIFYVGHIPGFCGRFLLAFNRSTRFDETRHTDCESYCGKAH